MFKNLNKSSSSVASAAFLLAVFVIASRIMGLVRDRILAGMFGAGQELDIYFAAFRIPDLIFNIFIGGAISAAFIPVFISYFAQNKKEAWDMAQSFFFVAIFGIIAIISAAYLFMPFLMRLVVPGFGLDQQDVTVFMSRIMLLSPLLLGISAMFSGILHSFRKFLIYSLAPIFYNGGIIVGAVYFTKFAGINGLAWGVALGALLHMLIQAPAAINSGFRVSLPKNVFHPGIKKIVRLMIPRAIGLGFNQINLWVITAIASTLAVGSLTIFNLANHIQYIPIGIVGMSFATAVFPTLSQYVSKKDYKNYLKEFSRTLRTVLFLVMPIGVLFFVLRAQIVRIILGTGQFSWEATQLTAASLGAFSFGIFAYALIPVVARAFYAEENTKTPVIATTIGVAVNIVLSLLLIYVIFPRNGILELIARSLKIENLNNINVIGLPVAFSISGIIALGLLFTAFFKKSRNRIIFKEIVFAFVRITSASLATGFMGWLALRWFVMFSDISTLLRIIAQTFFAGGMAFVFYIFISYVFKFEEFKVFASFARAKLNKVKLPKRGSSTTDMDGFSGDM